MRGIIDVSRWHCFLARRLRRGIIVQNNSQYLTHNGLLIPRRKRLLSSASQVGLAVLVACAGAVMWARRQEEAVAVRHLGAHIGQVRDARWLKRHPIDFG